MTPEFTAGFNAGIEAARKVVTEPNGCYCDACLKSDMEANVRAKRISALTVPSDLVAVPRDCRLWGYYVMPMPINKGGHGPATIGEDAVRIEYEVWKADLIQSIASFEYLPDAINRAMIAATEERG